MHCILGQHESCNRNMLMLSVARVFSLLGWGGSMNLALYFLPFGVKSPATVSMCPLEGRTCGKCAIESITEDPSPEKELPPG